jgi:hypothetical protein
MREGDARFVVCLTNRGYHASLVVRRLYLILPDPTAEKNHMIRVIDETGEDYLYPNRMFAAVAMTRSAERKLSAATASRRTP